MISPLNPSEVVLPVRLDLSPLFVALAPRQIKVHPSVSYIIGQLTLANMWMNEGIIDHGGYILNKSDAKLVERHLATTPSDLENIVLKFSNPRNGEIATLALVKGEQTAEMLLITSPATLSAWVKILKTYRDTANEHLEDLANINISMDLRSSNRLVLTEKSSARRSAVAESWLAYAAFILGLSNRIMKVYEEVRFLLVADNPIVRLTEISNSADHLSLGQATNLHYFAKTAHRFALIYAFCTGTNAKVPLQQYQAVMSKLLFGHNAVVLRTGMGERSLKVESIYTNLQVWQGEFNFSLLRSKTEMDFTVANGLGKLWEQLAGNQPYLFSVKGFSKDELENEETRLGRRHRIMVEGQMHSAQDAAMHLGWIGQFYRIDGSPIFSPLETPFWSKFNWEAPQDVMVKHQNYRKVADLMKRYMANIEDYDMAYIDAVVESLVITD